jgi:hypothetical protein
MYMASTKARALYLKSIGTLDFSYMSWYGRKNRSHLFPVFHNGEPSKDEFECRNRWGIARRNFFISHLSSMRNLNILEIPGLTLAQNRETADSLFFVLRDLPLRRLNLDNCENMEDFDLSALLGEESTVARSLVSLCISDNPRLTYKSADAIALNCEQLEELIWATSGGSVGAYNGYWRDFVEEGVQSFKRLGMRCRKLRKYFAPQAAGASVPLREIGRLLPR